MFSELSRNIKPRSTRQDEIAVYNIGGYNKIFLRNIHTNFNFSDYAGEYLPSFNQIEFQDSLNQLKIALKERTTFIVKDLISQLDYLVWLKNNQNEFFIDNLSRLIHCYLTIQLELSGKMFFLIDGEILHNCMEGDRINKYSPDFHKLLDLIHCYHDIIANFGKQKDIAFVITKYDLINDLSPSECNDSEYNSQVIHMKQVLLSLSTFNELIEKNNIKYFNFFLISCSITGKPDSQFITWGMDNLIQFGFTI
jgi:hypothetical protein